MLRYSTQRPTGVAAQAVCAVILLLLPRARSAAPKEYAVTDPGVCFRNADCARGEYCADILPTVRRREGPRLCTRQVPPGQPCDPNPYNPCTAGHACYSQAGGRMRCTPLGRAGEECGTETCRPGLACIFRGCSAPRANESLSPCTNTCGLRANAVEQGDGLRTLPAGAPCKSGQNPRCVGWCSDRSWRGDANGMCFGKQPENAVCDRAGQCEDGLVCNGQRRLNNCIAPERLLRVPGTPCDPTFDRCDDRRSLECAWSTRLRRHVCQHGVSLYKYCTPGSEFNRCTAAAECRPERRMIGRAAGPFFGCRAKRQIVPVGGLCTREVAHCEHGAQCRRPAGFGASVAAYCVKRRTEGQRCERVFEELCWGQYECKNGTCVAKTSMSRPGREKEDEYALVGNCSNKPCLPGLVCERFDDTWRLCRRPKTTVPLGGLCGEGALDDRTCAPGLVCIGGRNGMELERCSRPFPEGSFCLDDDSCVGRLKCNKVGELWRYFSDRRCYDPRKVLGIGDACVPNATSTEPRCIDERDRTSDGVSPPPLRCLKDGSGFFVCMQDVSLGDDCDPKNNVVCGDSRLVCSASRLCVQKTTQ